MPVIDLRGAAGEFNRGLPSDGTSREAHPHRHIRGIFAAEK